MGYTIKVQHPHFPEGTVFNVGGLDRVPNGSSLEVDEDMERGFLLERGMPLEDAFAGDHMVNVSGSSALDDDERQQLIEASPFYVAPEEQLADEGEPLVDENTPAWLKGNAGTSTTDVGEQNG